jgi:hypothetical protein
MPKPNIYTVGGAVQAGGGLYIQRQADNDLLKLCREGAFAYVLTSRQVGKSSLMVRAAEQLAEEGIHSVIVDLTVFGVQITAEAWYLGLLTAISDRLNLSTDVVEWWRSRAQFGDTQRLTEFFQNVLLAEVKERVVIFIDEIDSTLSLPAANGQPFTDDFYAAIRYFYNARMYLPEFSRLSFVLIGVATPSDLIRDLKRTPFNIGSRVDITDFTFEEALPLADGFEMPNDQARNVLRWVIKWTGGHPYLTQRLCRVVAEQYRSNWTEAEVDRTVANTFFGKMSEHDNNLQFVRDMLTRRAPDKLAVLSTYKDVRLGRMPVRDEEQSPIKSHLKLSGVVKREDGKLHVRNPIYRDVFDRGWIQEYWPVSWFQTIPTYVKVITAATFFLLLTSVIGLALYVQNVKAIAERDRRLIEAEQKRTEEAKKFVENERNLREIAEKQRQDADSAKSRAENFAMLEKAARAQADAERRRTQREKIVADSLRQEEEKARRDADERRVDVERRSLIEKARTLALQAERQYQLGNHELAMLLARHAYLFNEKYNGPWGNLIHNALIKTLGKAGGPVELNSQTSDIRALAFSMDGEWLAVGGYDGAVRLWNLKKSDKSPLILEGHKLGVRALAFDPSGQNLVSASDDHSVRWWKLQQDHFTSAPLQGHTKPVWALALSPDRRTLFSAGADRVVLGWNLDKLEQGPETRLEYPSRIRALAMSAGGQWLAAGGDHGSILICKRQPNWQRVAELNHAGGIKSLAFHPASNILISGDDGGKILQWHLPRAESQPTPAKEIGAHEAAVDAVAFSPDGRFLATAGSDAWIKLWAFHENSAEPFLTLKQNTYVRSVAFSPKGDLLAAAGGTDPNVRLWSIKTQTLADKVCEIVKRDLTPAEWREFVGEGIEYEPACAKPAAAITK